MNNNNNQQHLTQHETWLGLSTGTMLALIIMLLF